MATGEQPLWHRLAVWEGPGKMDLAATKAAAPVNDREAALLLNNDLYPGVLHCVPGKPGTWHLWDGRCHRPDDSAAIDRLLLGYAAAYALMLRHAQQDFNAVVAAGNPGITGRDLQLLQARQWKADWGMAGGPVAYAAKIQGAAGLGALRSVLGGVCGVSAEAFLDKHWRLLNAGNCVINLLPGEGEPEWYPHDPALMMAYCVEANWQPVPDPLTACPEFAHLLWRATGGDADVFWHLIKVLGYSILGRNPYHLVFFLSGPTASGKSALLEIVSAVLGARLAYDARPALISTSRDRHSRDEVSMTGRRLITIAETNDRLFIDELQLKRLTGQGSATVSPLFATETSSVPVTWAFIVANNDMPSVAHLDGALNRRIYVLPMGPTIPPEERNADKVLQVTERERDGILGLLVAGCRASMAAGPDGRAAILSPPLAVEAKTEEWKVTQDTVALWLADKCTAANGQDPAVEGRHALRDYVAWCAVQEPKLPPLGRNNFYESLGMQPGVGRSGDANHNWFRGFLLRDTPLD
jgi:putative DNA primase/helicase